MVILRSFSGGKSMLGASTRSKGKVGTRQRMLEVNATPHSPGTLAPSVITVDTRVLIDLWKSSSASTISDDPPPQPILSREIVRHGVVLLDKGTTGLGPLTGNRGRDPLFYLPYVSWSTSALDFADILYV